MTEKKDLNPEKVQKDVTEEFDAEQLDDETLEDASGGFGGSGCDCGCGPGLTP